MIQCLGNEVSPSFSEFPELALTEPDERLGDSIPALLDPEFIMPRIGGAAGEGFSHDLLGLLEQLLAEALTGEEGDEDELDFEDEQPFSESFLRRSS